MSALLMAFLATEVPIESVAVRPVFGRPGIVVTAHRTLPPAVVSRSGRTLVVRLPGTRLSTAYAGPRIFTWRTAATAGRSALPAEALRVAQAKDGVRLRFTMGRDVPVDLHPEGRVLRVSFTEPEPTSPAAEGPGTKARPQRPPRDACEAVKVVVEPSGPRALLRVHAGAGLADARVRREGGEVIVTFDAGALSVPPSPPAAPPMDDVHVEKVATLAVIHVKVAAEVPFEVKREPGLLTLTFGEETALEKIAPAPKPPPPPGGVDVSSLVSPEIYKGLFPGSHEAGDQREVAAGSDLAREGLQVGPVHLRPAVLVSYIQGDYTLLDTPEPVADRYVQIEPRLAADMPLLGGELTADYALRLRFLSDFDQINTSSHLVNAGLEVPLGSSMQLRLHDHFSTGTLESTEVDPGQEYFFDLSRFRRNDVELGLQVDAGSRIFLDGTAGYNHVDFDDPQGFFPYSATSARLGAGLTLGDNLRGALYYSYDRVPPPDSRPLVESTSHAFGVSFDGDLGALTQGQVRIDYQSTSAPAAAAGGQTFRGMAGSLQLSRDLSPTSRLSVLGRRATDLSAFEENAFYVSTGGQVLFSTGVVWSISANLGLGYQENRYQTVSTTVGAPREDSIFGWTLGLSRPVGSFAFVRADYRRDRRRSNLPGFDLETDGFVVQVGLGLFGTSVRR